MLEGDARRAQIEMLTAVVLPDPAPLARLRAFMARGARPDYAEDQHLSSNGSAVHQAARTGSACWFPAFEALGVCLAVRDLMGQTPAMVAVNNGRGEILEALHACKVSLVEDRLESGGGTLLQLAARHGHHPELVDVLVGAGVGVDEPDRYGWPPLWHALEHEAMLQALLSHGARLDHRSRVGKTVAHVAATRAPASCVRFLVEAGADFDALDDDGRSAMQVLLQDRCRARNIEQIEDELVSALAAWRARQALDLVGSTPDRQEFRP